MRFDDQSQHGNARSIVCYIYGTVNRELRGVAHRILKSWALAGRLRATLVERQPGRTQLMPAAV